MLPVLSSSTCSSFWLVFESTNEEAFRFLSFATTKWKTSRLCSSQKSQLWLQLELRPQETSRALLDSLLIAAGNCLPFAVSASKRLNYGQEGDILCSATFSRPSLRHLQSEEKQLSLLRVCFELQPRLATKTASLRFIKKACLGTRLLCARLHFRNNVKNKARIITFFPFFLLDRSEERPSNCLRILTANQSTFCLTICLQIRFQRL